MLKYRVFLLSLMSIVALMSCNKDNGGIVIENEPIEVSTLEATLDMIVNFEKDAQTKGGDYEPIIIEKYEKTTYSFSFDPSVQTRSESNQEIDPIGVYLVTFKKGDSKGYSIATGDERVNRIYAYTDCGEIGDTAKIEPLKVFIQSIPYIVEEDLRAYYEQPESNSVNTRAAVEVNIGPLLRTRWTQGTPYNNLTMLCSYAGSGYGGHVPVGCGGLAAAQVIAYYGKFKGTYYGNENINFTTLTAQPTIASNSTLATTVASFCREVAIFCQTKFTCSSGGTSGGTHLQAVSRYLKDQGYSCSYESGNVNLYKLYQNLNTRNVHLTRGVSNGNGHAWIWDGMRATLNGTTLTNVLLHCNWGNSVSEGGTTNWSNGWFANYTTPPGQSNYSGSSQQCYITQNR